MIANSGQNARTFGGLDGTTVPTVLQLLREKP